MAICKKTNVIYIARYGDLQYTNHKRGEGEERAGGGGGGGGVSP